MNENLKDYISLHSILGPVFFNVLICDQALPQGMKSFIYAEDVALPAQLDRFPMVEHFPTGALEDLDA